MSKTEDMFRALLSGGGVWFDRKRHGDEMKRFAELEREKELEKVAAEEEEEAEDGAWEDGNDDEIESAGEEQDGKEEEEEEEEKEPALFAKRDEDEEKAFDAAAAAADKNKQSNKQAETPGSVLLKHMHLAPKYAAQWHKIHSMYTRHGIRIAGNDIEPPLVAFSELVSRFHVAPRLADNLRKAGLVEPTPIQMAALPAMLRGRETIGIAPTGSGKTLAYVLPLVHTLTAYPHAAEEETEKETGSKRGYRSVVLCPTRELAMQIYRVIRRFSDGCHVRVALLTKGTVDSSSEAERPGELFDILVATPLRLVNMILAGLVDLSIVRTIVFDEADRLFDRQFVEQVDEIVAACQKHIEGRAEAEAEAKRRLQVCLFSATMSPHVEQLASSLMTDPVRVFVGRSNVSLSTIEQHLVFAGNEHGKLIELQRMLDSGTLKLPALVFVQNKERATDLQDRLLAHLARSSGAAPSAARSAKRVRTIHAELSVAQRERIVDDFRTGSIWVLVATDMMSRGMDFRGVACVVNYDMPLSVADYVHRVGRTGRAGARGLAFTFYTEADGETLRSLAGTLEGSGCAVPDWVKSLKPVSARRKRFLQYHAVQRADVGDTQEGPAAAERQQQKGKSAGDGGGKKTRMLLVRDEHGRKKHAAAAKKRTVTVASMKRAREEQQAKKSAKAKKTKEPSAKRARKGSSSSSKK